MMREIVPAEILSDDFVEKLLYIYNKVYEECKESHPEWFKDHEACKEFITNIKDKYLYE